MPNEIHYKRFIQVIEKNSKIWTVDNLLKAINFLLPSNIEMTERELIKLINKQQHFKVFKCKVHHQKGRKTYYIFKRCLPE